MENFNFLCFGTFWRLIDTSFSLHSDFVYSPDFVMFKYFRLQGSSIAFSLTLLKPSWNFLFSFFCCHKSFLNYFFKLQHEEELRSVCVPKQLVIETYWAKLREVYTTYQEEHTPIMGHYHSLREKDDFYQKEIARNDFQIQLATVRSC